MKQISGKNFCKVLSRHGWELLRVNGSHHIYGKPGEEVKISVPVHANKPLKLGLLTYFLKTANLSESDL